MSPVRSKESEIPADLPTASRTSNGMSISEEISFDKEGRIERFPLFKKIFLPLVIILVAGLSFGIGRLSVVSDREPIKIEYDESLSTKFEASNPKPTTGLADRQITNQTANVVNAVPKNGEVVASKNGTKYHYLHCSGAKQIKEENKIVFASPSAAEAAGYTLASNCKPK